MARLTRDASVQVFAVGPLHPGPNGIHAHPGNWLVGLVIFGQALDGEAGPWRSWRDTAYTCWWPGTSSECLAPGWCDNSGTRDLRPNVLVAIRNRPAQVRRAPAGYPVLRASHLVRAFGPQAWWQQKGAQPRPSQPGTARAFPHFVSQARSLSSESALIRLISQVRHWIAQGQLASLGMTGWVPLNQRSGIGSSTKTPAC